MVFVPKDLPSALDACWSLVERAVADRRSAFHTPVLATVASSGAPEVRTVVLRSASAVTWTVGIHTDRRSAKVACLGIDPRASILFYDPGLRVQVRLAGIAAVHIDDAVSDAAWQRSQAMSRRCYGQVGAPGSVAADPDSATRADISSETFARSNFSVVRIAAERMDCLFLAASGHRRALFQRSRDGAVTSAWLAP